MLYAKEIINDRKMFCAYCGVEKYITVRVGYFYVCKTCVIANAVDETDPHSMIPWRLRNKTFYVSLNSDWYIRDFSITETLLDELKNTKVELPRSE